MLLRMKNFNILGVHQKIRLLEGVGGFTQNQDRGEDCLKERGWKFADLKGGGSW